MWVPETHIFELLSAVSGCIKKKAGLEEEVQGLKSTQLWDVVVPSGSLNHCAIIPALTN